MLFVLFFLITCLINGFKESTTSLSSLPITQCTGNELNSRVFGGCESHTKTLLQSKQVNRD